MFQNLDLKTKIGFACSILFAVLHKYLPIPDWVQARAPEVVYALVMVTIWFARHQLVPSGGWSVTKTSSVFGVLTAVFAMIWQLPPDLQQLFDALQQALLGTAGAGFAHAAVKSYNAPPPPQPSLSDRP